MIPSSLDKAHAGPASHGVVMHLREVIADGSDGQSVRTLGRLVAFDPNTTRATIEDRGAHLAVDTRLIEGALLREGDLLQLIGELRVEGRSTLVLHARCVQNATGLNLDTHDRAVEAQRAFLAEVAGLEAG